MAYACIPLPLFATGTDVIPPAPVPLQPVGVLLVHGLGGTEADLGSLRKILQRAGVQVHALTLPGHGSQPHDLLQVTAEDWVACVQMHYRELALRYQTVHVIGMCLGALVAIEAIKQLGGSKGRLVALAPPVFIDGWAMPWYRGLRHVVYRLPALAHLLKVPEAEPFGIKNELMRAIVKGKLTDGDRFHYPWVPLACIQEVDRLRRQVRRKLDTLRSPTLIIHAREDELTSLRSAQFLVRKLGAATARMVILENSYHMICVDNDRAQVAAEVLRHLGLDITAARRRMAPPTAATL